MGNLSPIDRAFMEISRKLDLARKESRDKGFQKYKNECKEIIESLVGCGIDEICIYDYLYDRYLETSKED